MTSGATRFPVRYGPMVKWTSALGTVLLLGIAAVGLAHFRGDVLGLSLTLAIPLVTLPAALLFMVRGYELSTEGVYVVRPIGRKCIASAVTKAVPDETALKGTLRTFGNGGLFSISGRFWSRRYGHCRVWVTDLRDMVVLWQDRRCAIVSPAERTRFLAAVTERLTP